MSQWGNPAVLTSFIVALAGLFGAIGGLLAAWRSSNRSNSAHLVATNAHEQAAITDAKIETLTKVVNGNITQLAQPPTEGAITQ